MTICIVDTTGEHEVVWQLDGAQLVSAWVDPPDHVKTGSFLLDTSDWRADELAKNVGTQAKDPEEFAEVYTGDPVGKTCWCHAKVVQDIAAFWEEKESRRVRTKKGREQHGDEPRPLPLYK